MSATSRNSSPASGDRLMANRPAHVKQTSIKRAIAAVLGAGLSVERIAINEADGTIIITPGRADGNPVEMTELERWKAGRRHARTP
jgi:hypothetical protein